MARKGLPAKYIKQAHGDMKKAWAAYKRAHGTRKGRSTSKKRGGSVAKRRDVRRRASVRRRPQGRVKRAIRSMGG